MDGQGLSAIERRRGMDRRGFLRLLVAGGAAAAAYACSSPPPREVRPPGAAGEPPARSAPWFKDPAPFIRHADGKSLEARLELMQGLITPAPLFFVRNNSASVDVDAGSWRLTVEGDAVATPLEISYEALRRMPGRTLVSALECAGNHRAMFARVAGREAEGTQWGSGAVGNGSWTGVALRDVLEAAGIEGDAASVLLVGMDRESPEGGFRRVLPVEKAMHRDTLLAYELNGERLPRDHGYPVRALVPGWVGAASIKWLRCIVVTSRELWTRNNTTSYVLVGDAYEPVGEALGPPLTRQTIKSALALPWPAVLGAGSHRLAGYAQTPDPPITRVEWSEDSGRTWHDATLIEGQRDYSWCRFEFAWEARPGRHSVMTRATDRAGSTQPPAIPFNSKGYLFNQPVPHPIRAG